MSDTTAPPVDPTAPPAGGQPETPADTPPATPPGDAEGDPAGAEHLGDKGKKALDSMKAERNAERDARKKVEEELAALKAAAEGKEAEHKAAQEAQRIKDEALAAANQRILKAEIRAAAAGKLADPADALLHIDLSEFEVDSDGGVDAAAIASAIDDLVGTKPYLAAQGGTRFQGSGDGGTRKEARPAQLTEADVKRLYAEGKHEEIVQAKADGRLKDYLGS